MVSTVDLNTVGGLSEQEAIADLCHFTPQQQRILATQISEMANQGLRVLGVAKASLIDAPPAFLPPHASLNPEHLPDEQHDFPFQFVGLVGLSDPVRPNVATAIQECYTAGIRVVMITGDYPGTAQSIARALTIYNIDFGKFILNFERRFFIAPQPKNPEIS